MKLKTAATIATVIVIVVGAAMISPLFFKPENVDKRIMLTFSVTNPHGATEWCQNLTSILNSYDLPATVFVAGKIAEQYPQIVTCFGEKVDIGNQPYSNKNLTDYTDYTLKLQEVQNGKAAVDKAGNFNSKAFQATNGATDEDIFSLLGRSGIYADFSYTDHYNVYQNGQFIKYPALVFDASNHTPEYIEGTRTLQPIILQFNNNIPTDAIQTYLSTLTHGDFEFVNASQLTGLDLTVQEA
ncbi:MAG: polysaccharide deacetylase family protein [Methanocella sp.]